MRINNINSINEIIGLLNQFIEGKIVNLGEINRENPKIFHYFTEIVRYWSKLNYIFRKTLRSLKSFDVPEIEKAKYIYAVYRKIQENASNKSLIKELHSINSQDSNLLQFLGRLKQFSWKRALEGKSRREKLSIKEAIPTFFIDRLLSVTSFEFLEGNVKIMNRFHNYDNFLRMRSRDIKIPNQVSIKNMENELKTYDIPIKKDREIPELYYIPNDKKSLILKSKFYISGNLIFQDKASAAVVKVLSPYPTDFICDMCAAPGNKTNLISQYTGNQAQIIAGEFLTVRAYKMSKLINTSNTLNIHLINTDSIQFPLRFDNGFDKVLLDAPCTGSGTFITNPELKWRQNKYFLHQNITLQEKLIASALKLLKPNGVFVYSTCSLYPEEGELQILKFLDKLEPLQIPEWFSPSYLIDDYLIQGTGRLFPLIHHTQGFFIGKFKKKEE